MKHIEELIGMLEIMAMEDDDSGHKECAKNIMEAAGMLKKMSAALQPFAAAAVRADESAAEQQRLLGSSMGPNASPGWGIKRHHLDAAREILGGNSKL